MTCLLITPPPVPASALIELKALLRLETVEEEALLAALLRAALDQAESFTGTVWLRGVYQESRNAVRSIILCKRPFVQLVLAETETAQGVRLPVDTAKISIQCSDHGEAMLSIALPMDNVLRLHLRYDAGTSDDWNLLPEALRAGLLRHAAWLFQHRDSGRVEIMPDVAALWLPFKQLRLM